VSVVIPSYNRAELVVGAVNSALAQDWDPMEVIVVDDGSTDDTVERLHALMGRDVRLRVIALDRNSGASAARNLGIVEARHEYVALLDSDNEFVVGKLRRQMELLQETPDRAVAFSGYTQVTDGSTADVLLDGWSEAPEATIERLLAGCCVNTSTLVAPREALVNAGGFDEQLICAEDHDLWLRLAARGCRFLYIRDALALYRFHSASLSADEAQVASDSERVIKAFLADPELPAEILERRRRYLARWALNSAVRYLAAGDGRASLLALARASLTSPAAIRPGWLRIAFRAAHNLRQPAAKRP
jgi:glycosyltransferase involved in cell wall biosynthesis